MWSPIAATASSRVTGRFLWPLSRRFASSNGVASRSFGTGRMMKQNHDCGSAGQSSMCKPKPPPCKKRPCPAPCHACPAQDPCWHCPYTPPKCIKRKPCCPICPTEPSPYQFQDNCCPPSDLCKRNCVSCEPAAPPPRRLTRCELPGADDDPCCSRKPKCPNPCLKPGEQQENTCQYSDCPDRPEPPDPCKIDGEICTEEDCSFKKKERCCSDKPADCCPRMQKNKQKKKRQIKRACCMDLDPNWPPKRKQCACDFPPKEAAPCQQQICKKKEFWDGLC